MNKLFKIVYITILILLILHYYKYRTFTKDYEIQQQELDYIDGNELYNQLNPLIITFIEDANLKHNVSKYKLHSLMSFSFKNAAYNTNEHYLSHNNEMVLLRPKTKLIIELVNPKFKSMFNYKKRDSLFNQYQLNPKEFKNVSAIDIVVHEYNILYIPRHWLFKCLTPNQSVEIFSSHNLFSYIFSILH